jgi:hypothetical protein
MGRCVSVSWSFLALDEEAQSEIKGRRAVGSPSERLGLPRDVVPKKLE